MRFNPAATHVRHHWHRPSRPSTAALSTASSGSAGTRPSAIGVWDTRRDTLLLATDRFGKKPLYYSQHGATVCFASDSKAFWSLPGAALTVNHAAIDCYLHHLAVTTDHTRGAAQHTHRLWSLLWLELWHRIFIARSLTGRESLRS